MRLNAKNAFAVLWKYMKKSCPEKFNHSVKVAIISQKLAMKWGGSVTDAMIAAMLHDIGKSMNKKQMMIFCMENNIPVYQFEVEENMAAVHGRISAFLFEKAFEGNDRQRIEKISHAISSHVAGDESMSLLDKIIFIADNLESKDEGKELLVQIRTGQIDDPDECVRRVIEQKIERNNKKGYVYNPFLDVTLAALDEGR